MGRMSVKALVVYCVAFIVVVGYQASSVNGLVCYCMVGLDDRDDIELCDSVTKTRTCGPGGACNVGLAGELVVQRCIYHQFSIQNCPNLNTQLCCEVDLCNGIDNFTEFQASQTNNGGSSTDIAASSVITPPTVVPTPTISLTAPNTQTLGQSLTLQCEVTTVRGITSGVDIVWSSGGIELQRMNNVSSTTINNSLVYTDSYTISQLSTDDVDRVIQCQVVISASPSVMVNDSITLNVTVPTPIIAISPPGPIQGAMVGSPLVINCTVSTVSGMESSSVMISWIGPEGVITNDSRVAISPATSSGNTYTSSIQFTYLMKGDEGTHSCIVMISGASENATIEIQSLTGTPISNNTDNNSDIGAIMGGILGGIVLLLMIFIVFCIVIVYHKKWCRKAEVFHVYEEIHYNGTKLNTRVTIKHGLSYDVVKDEAADSTINMDTNPSYEESIREERETAFSTTAANSDTKAHQSSEQHDYDNVHDDSGQLCHIAATNTPGNEKEDNVAVQIHNIVDHKHNTEEIRSSTKPTDEGEYGVINQPQCGDPNFDITTVDQSHITESSMIASSTSDGKYGVINQPQCNDPCFDITDDKSHDTKPFSPLIVNNAGFTDEGKYGVINQPQCDDPNFDIAVDQSRTTESPVITKLTDEGKYGVINQPQCDYPDCDIIVGQSSTTKACLPLIGNNANESEYGIINQPQCNDLI